MKTFGELRNPFFANLTSLHRFWYTGTDLLDSFQLILEKCPENRKKFQAFKEEFCGSPCQMLCLSRGKCSSYTDHDLHCLGVRHIFC